MADQKNSEAYEFIEEISEKGLDLSYQIFVFIDISFKLLGNDPRPSINGPFGPAVITVRDHIDRIRTQNSEFVRWTEDSGKTTGELSEIYPEVLLIRDIPLVNSEHPGMYCIVHRTDTGDYQVVKDGFSDRDAASEWRSNFTGYASSARETMSDSMHYTADE